MRKMKRLIALFAALAVIFSLGNSAFAAEQITPTEVMQSVDFAPRLPPGILRFDQIVDLGTSGRESFRWSVDANDYGYSKNEYKTNSTRLYLSITGDQTVSFRVTLYNITDPNNVTKVGEPVVKTILKNSSTKWSFSNLSHSQTYYFKFENLSNVLMNGTFVFSAN